MQQSNTTRHKAPYDHTPTALGTASPAHFRVVPGKRFETHCKPTIAHKSPDTRMKTLSLLLLALVTLSALSHCKARQLHADQAAAAVKGGCNQLEVKAPNCPGSEVCFFRKKAYSGCDNCVASYHDACYKIGAEYTALEGPRVNVEEAVFYRFGQKVVSGVGPEQKYSWIVCIAKKGLS